MTNGQPNTEDVTEVKDVKDAKGVNDVQKPLQTPKAVKPSRTAASTPGAIAVASLRKKQRY